MVYIIESNNVNNLFIKTARALLSDGKIVSPGGNETIELSHVVLGIDDIVNPVCTLKSRRINMNYLNKEMEWYLNGDYNADMIRKHASIWDKIADENGNVNSNYGYTAFRRLFNGMSQYDWCLSTLSSDNESRQAIINYNMPEHKYIGNKDFPCTIGQMFKINNGLLDTNVIMRSNDLIYGFTYDLPFFAHVQKRLASDLNVGIGRYEHFANSLHVYKRHYDMLEDIAREGVE